MIEKEHVKLESEKKNEGEEKTMCRNRLKRLPNSSPTHISSLHQYFFTLKSLNQSERPFYHILHNSKSDCVKLEIFFAENFNRQTHKRRENDSFGEKMILLEKKIIFRVNKEWVSTTKADDGDDDKFSLR